MESKICGIKDSFTLNYIINHNFPPQYIGFICNYKNSKRFISFDKLSLEQRSKLGANARKYFEKEFERDKLLLKLIDIFNQ